MDEDADKKWNPDEFKEYELPWMKLIVGDILASGFVSMLSDMEYTAYMKLMLFQWRYAAIPDDMARISNYLGKDPRTTKKIMAHLHTKFTGRVHLMSHSMATKKADFMFNIKLHMVRVQQVANHKQAVINGKKGGSSQKTTEASASPPAPPSPPSNSDTQNSELRETELKSSVNSVIQCDPPPLRKTTEPINKAKKTNYSNKTCWAISQAINNHRAVFEGEALNDSPVMKKLFIALVSVPEIDPENQRLLAYVIQAKEAPKPKNLEERLGYAISLLKAPKYAPADSAMQTAKDLISLWQENTGVKRQIADIIEQAKSEK